MGYLVVVLEYTFFLLCSNVEQIYVRLARFRRSYINRPGIVLTNDTSSQLFCLMCAALFKVAPILFFSCLSPMIVHLRKLFLLSTPVARMLLTLRWVSRQKDVKYLSINTSKLTVGVKHSTSRRTTFSPNPYLVGEATCFPFFAP